MWKRVRHRVGHRGAFLLFLALLDWALAYALLTLPPAAVAAQHLVPPATFWAGAWVFVGAVCVVGAFVREDRFAYAGAAGIKAAWAAVSVRTWLAGHTPQGWVAVVIWLAFAVTVLLISSWPEPQAPPRVPPPPEVRRL